MKTLVCFYGLDRATNVAFPYFEPNVVEHLGDVDILTSLSSRHADPDEFLPARSRYAQTADEPDDYRPLLGTHYKDRSAGNWVTHGVHIYYHKMRVRELVLDRDLWTKYDWFVIARTDMLWLAPHVDFREFPPCAMIPEGEDWGGVNDRHFVCHRDHVIQALSQWDVVTDDDHPLWRVLLQHRELNTEQCLALYLDHHRIPVRRFQSAGFLTGTPTSYTGWAGIKHDPLHSFHYKYKSEYERALRNAETLRR